MARFLVGVGALLRFEGRRTEVSDRLGRFLAVVGPGGGLCCFQKILQRLKTKCWVLMTSLMMQAAMELGSSVLVRSSNDSRSSVTTILVAFCRPTDL